MKAWKRASPTRPRTTFENGELESVPRHEHRSETVPGGGVWKLGELVVDPGLAGVLAAEDHRPAVLQRRGPGAARRLRQVREANPRRALGVKAVHASCRWGSASGGACAGSEHESRGGGAPPGQRRPRGPGAGRRGIG